MRLAITTLFIGALASTASAQDPTSPSASFWDGYYVGAVLGYGDTSSVHCVTACDPDTTALPTPGSTGGVFGVTAGYNFTNGRFVFGIEGDYMGGNLDGTAPDQPEYRLGAGRNYVTNINGIATLRGRVGLDQGNFMPYLTAGIAALSVEGALEGLTPADPTPSSTDILFSPVAGLGAEWRLDSGWSIKAEYLHVFDTGRFFYDFPNGREWCNNPGCALTDVHVDLFRIGLNWHF